MGHGFEDVNKKHLKPTPINMSWSDSSRNNHDFVDMYLMRCITVSEY